MDKDEEGKDWRADVGKRSDPGSLAIDEARAREPGRGRDARSPQDIPARGWKDVLLRVLWSISADRVLSTSGGVAFFGLLAIFPALGTVVSLYGLFADPSMVGRHLGLVAGFLPGGVLSLIADEVARISGQTTGTLGLAFVVGLLIALWSANSGVAALFDALNVVYDEKEKRSLLRFYTTTFLFTLGGIGFAVLALLGVVAVPVLLRFVGIQSVSEQLISMLRWPVLIASLMLALALIYRFGPSRNDARWRWVTWGSVAAALLWMAASMLFSWYVSSFDSYTRTYGALGAVVGFMMWLWISTVVVLLGAELNAEMEHQTAQDTTDGRPKPLGRRGAMMADHVGEAQG